MADENNTQPPADLAGYPSTDELVRGYRNSSAEAKRLAEENQRLQQAAQMAAANPRQDIPNRGRPEDRLAEFGIPADALSEFVNERLGQALAPLARGFEARSRVLTEYPDYQKYEADVANYVNSDPEFSQQYNRLFAADPAGAMQLAFLKFGENRRKNVPVPPSSIPQEVADAALPGARSGDTRRAGDGTSNDVQEAWENYQKTGSSRDAETYAKARLKQAIPDEFFTR